MEPRPPWTAADADVEPSGAGASAVPAGAEDPAADESEPGTVAEPTSVVAEAVAEPTSVVEPTAPDVVADGRPTLDLDAVTADLAAVEAALERLDQGGYGRCGACASVIDDDVLAADPTATTCAAHLPV